MFFYLSFVLKDVEINQYKEEVQQLNTRIVQLGRESTLKEEKSLQVVNDLTESNSTTTESYKEREKTHVN